MEMNTLTTQETPVTRNQFTFYISFYECIRSKSKKEQLLLYNAICVYALYGTDPGLPEKVNSDFNLIRPTLDSSRRKALGAMRHGRETAGKDNARMPQGYGEDNAKITQGYGEDNAKITQRYTKDNANKGENKKEYKYKYKNEYETETETEYKARPGRGPGPVQPPPTPERETALTEGNAFGRVITAYMNRICPTPSSTCIAMLQDFCRELGAEVCLRAIDTAIDAGRPTWPYIRAILNEKRSLGIDSLEKWDAQEHRRRGAALSPKEEDINAQNSSPDAVDRLMKLYARMQAEEDWTPGPASLREHAAQEGR